MSWLGWATSGQFSPLWITCLPQNCLFQEHGQTVTLLPLCRRDAFTMNMTEYPQGQGSGFLYNT